MKGSEIDQGRKGEQHYRIRSLDFLSFSRFVINSQSKPKFGYGSH